MNHLADHYGLLLGLDASWQVRSVELSLDGNRVDIRLESAGGQVTCPRCAKACPIADHATERTWRHLDTMQFETRIHARVPRSRCVECGVLTVAIPWADKHSRFTLMFEAFAIEVLRTASSINRAAALLRLDWDSVQTIMRRGVERGLSRRTAVPLPHVGMDEKSFLRGQSYVSILTDLDGSRVLEVADGRDARATDRLWQSLPEAQRKSVKAVALDMSATYAEGARRNVPQAEIVHDRFHVSKHLGEAVDQVRRKEHAKLLREGHSPLTGTRQLWLFREANLPDRHQAVFRDLKASTLRTARAWSLKEMFVGFWTFSLPGAARNYFSRWYGAAVRCRLTPMVGKAKMLKRHLEGLLSFVRHRITNALSEAFNSRIQEIKSTARGFRNFEHYRIRILFHLGKLDMRPARAGHDLS